jgi:hypothetical protein
MIVERIRIHAWQGSEGALISLPTQPSGAIQPSALIHQLSTINHQLI